MYLIYFNFVMTSLWYYFSFILIQNILDINKDGKVDNKDLQHGLDKVRDVLEYNMPSGGGFTAGLMLGLRGWSCTESKTPLFTPGRSQ